VNCITGDTYSNHASRWGKISARQLTLNDFITTNLFYRVPKI